MSTVAVVAMDIHKKFSKAVALDAEARVVAESRVTHEDHAPMRAFFGSLPAGMSVVMEATFNWPWISDVAESMGLSPHLAHAGRAREMAKGMAKSDRKDAIFLGRLFLAGEIFPEVYRAPREVRRMRGLFRQRLLLVRMRTAVKNSTHGQLFRLGVTVDGSASDLFGAKGRRLLGKLALDAHERWLLEGKLSTIDDLTRQIGLLEEVIETQLSEDARAEILQSLPGVGWLTAYAVLAEMGELDRFANGRALAAYAGLLPLDCESAEKDFGKRTNKACNRHLRWAMLEAVSGAVRKSPRMASLAARVRAKNPKKPGKGCVAVARELLELAHLLLTRGELYEEDRPSRPGSRGRVARRTSRRHRASQVTLCARPVVGDQAAE